METFPRQDEKVGQQILMNDLRRAVFIRRLSSFSKPQVQRIVDNIDKICFDTWNYDEATGKFCPLAIALGVDQVVFPTNDIVRDIIGNHGFSPVNALKGIPGTFYTDRRREDLLEVCNEVLSQK